MNTKVKEIISKVVLSDKKLKIKLLGDSITHGVGGTGYNENGEHIILNYARNTDGYCWANLFKKHMESHYNCSVVNNACSGTAIEHIIDSYDQLVDSDDDIVICAIGTNNRSQRFDNPPKRTKQEHMKYFYNKIIKLYYMLKEDGKDVIFIANIPASVENEKDGSFFWRLFHMNDVNDIYMKASITCGFPFVSLYSLFMEYCNLKDRTVESFLDDTVHPNDEGHSVIFRLLMKEFGLGIEYKG